MHRPLMPRIHRVFGVSTVQLLLPVNIQMAEVAVPRELFRLILARIRRLRLPARYRADDGKRAKHAK